jgi:hypothetical protein
MHKTVWALLLQPFAEEVFVDSVDRNNAASAVGFPQPNESLQCFCRNLCRSRDVLQARTVLSSLSASTDAVRKGYLKDFPNDRRWTGRGDSI